MSDQEYAAVEIVGPALTVQLAAGEVRRLLEALDDLLDRLETAIQLEEDDERAAGLAAYVDELAALRDAMHSVMIEPELGDA